MMTLDFDLVSSLTALVLAQDPEVGPVPFLMQLIYQFSDAHISHASVAPITS